MATITPPAKVPIWLKLLFPAVKGLEENPLYIRLTRQGFGRKPRWYRSRAPKEFARASGALWERLGCVPLTIWIGSYLASILLSSVYAFSSVRAPVIRDLFFLTISFLSLIAVIGFILFVTRLIGVSGNSVARRFILNARSQHWGEALYLSPLDPHEYDRAVFAFGVSDLARDAAKLVIAISLVVGALIFYVRSLTAGMQFDILFDILLEILAIGASIVAALFLEIFMIGVVHLALALRYAVESAGQRFLSLTKAESIETLIMVAVHLPGSLLVYLMFRYIIPDLENPWDFWFYMTTVLILFYGANLPIAYAMTRYLLRVSDGNLGRALGVAIRREDK